MICHLVWSLHTNGISDLKRLCLDLLLQVWPLGLDIIFHHYFLFDFGKFHHKVLWVRKVHLWFTIATFNAILPPVSLSVAAVAFSISVAFNYYCCPVAATPLELSILCFWCGYSSWKEWLYLSLVSQLFPFCHVHNLFPPLIPRFLPSFYLFSHSLQSLFDQRQEGQHKKITRTLLLTYTSVSAVV